MIFTMLFQLDKILQDKKFFPLIWKFAAMWTSLVMPIMILYLNYYTSDTRMIGAVWNSLWKCSFKSVKLLNIKAWNSWQQCLQHTIHLNLGMSVQCIFLLISHLSSCVSHLVDFDITIYFYYCNIIYVCWTFDMNLSQTFLEKKMN